MTSPELTSVRLNGSSGSTGEPFDIPGGSSPVSVVRLRSEPSTRAFSLQVTFPQGWDRPVGGHYLCAEDVVFLSGRLRIGDAVFTAGDWAHMPAGFLRSGMRAEAETVAIARFSGPARWVEGPADTSPSLVRRPLSAVADAIPTPLGAPGQLLRRGEPDSSWLLYEPPTVGSTATVEAELVDLEDPTWHHVIAGAPIPALRGRAFCWSFEA